MFRRGFLLVAVLLSSLSLFLYGCAGGLNQLAGPGLSTGPSSQKKASRCAFIQNNSFDIEGQHGKVTANAWVSFGKSLSGSLDSTGAYDVHYLSSTAGTPIIVDLWGPNNADFDLYVYEYSSDTWYCSYTETSNEQVQLTFRTAGDIAIIPYSYSGSGEYTVLANIGGREVTLIEPGTYGDTLNSAGDYQIWGIQVSQGSHISIDLAGPSNADFDLYIRMGDFATPCTYDDYSAGYTSNERIDYTPSSSGWLYIAVQSYEGSGWYTLTVQGAVSASTIILTPPYDSAVGTSSGPCANVNYNAKTGTIRGHAISYSDYVEMTSCQFQASLSKWYTALTSNTYILEASFSIAGKAGACNKGVVYEVLPLGASAAEANVELQMDIIDETTVELLFSQKQILYNKRSDYGILTCDIQSSFEQSMGGVVSLTEGHRYHFSISVIVNVGTYAFGFTGAQALAVFDSTRFWWIDSERYVDVDGFIKLDRIKLTPTAPA